MLLTVPQANKLMAELLEQGRETLLRKPADLENCGLKS